MNNVTSRLSFLMVILCGTMQLHAQPTRVVPIQFSLWDDLDRIALDAKAEVYGLRLCLRGESKGVTGLDLGLIPFTQRMRGIQLAGLLGYVEDSMIGIQLGGVCVAGNIRGIQLGGLLNVAGSMWTDSYSALGIQVSGLINLAFCDVTGIQVALGYGNVAGDMSGIQIAPFFNGAEGMRGLQLAGIANIGQYRPMRGLQLAVIANIVDDGPMRGAQLSILNYVKKSNKKYNRNSDGNMTGMQIGLINKAEKVHGLQVGIYNDCRSLKGVQIGLVNVIRENSVPILPIINASF